MMIPFFFESLNLISIVEEFLLQLNGAMILFDRMIGPPFLPPLPSLTASDSTIFLGTALVMRCIAFEIANLFLCTYVYAYSQARGILRI